MKKSKQNVEGLIVQVQQQLTYLDKKIDALIAQLSTGASEPHQHTKPAAQPQPLQRFSQPGSHGDSRQSNDFKDRVLHKTICAECQKECEVPFRPSGDRPVYCKACFAGHKPAGSFRQDTGGRPRGEGHGRERSSYDRPRYESRRPSTKKTFTKKRKPRSY